MLPRVNHISVAVGDGFGPSTQRLVEVNESFETKLKMSTRPMPPAIGILAFTAAFLCFVFGVTLIYENEKVLGSVLLIVGVALVVLPIIWTIKNRQ